MKKLAAALLIVCVVCASGVAFAQPKQAPQRQGHPAFNANEVQQQGRYFEPPCWSGNWNGNFNGNGRPCFCDNNGPRRQQEQGPRRQNGRFGFEPDMPKEVRAKAVELAKLRIDLEEALSQRPLNKAKAIEVHAAISKIEQELDAWRFEKRLERMEEVRTQQELNRKVRPAFQPAPKAPEAPEMPEAPTEQAE